MRFEKGPDGRLYVYLDGIKAVRDANGRASRGLYGDGSGDEPTDAARKVVEAKDEAIRILQRQLEEEREARRRAGTIIAQLTQLNVTLVARVPGLDDSSTEPPDTVGETVTTADGGPMATECGSPWWRRRWGRV